MLNQLGTYLALSIFIKPKSKEVFCTRRGGQFDSGDFFLSIGFRFRGMNNWIAVSQKAAEQGCGLGINSCRHELALVKSISHGKVAERKGRHGFVLGADFGTDLVRDGWAEVRASAGFFRASAKT